MLSSLINLSNIGTRLVQQGKRHPCSHTKARYSRWLEEQYLCVFYLSSCGKSFVYDSIYTLVRVLSTFFKRF